MTMGYPIPKSLRQTDIFLGGGGAAYGPFDFKIFDVDDVEVWTLAVGDVRFSKVETVTIAKVANLPFDDFTVTFAAPQPLTTEIVVVSRRLDERSAGVLSGTRIDPDALEKEFSKISTEMQELRRDIGTATRSDFGQGGFVIDPGLQDGEVLMKQGDRFVRGPDAGDIILAEGFAAAAHISANLAHDAALQAAADAEAAVAAAAAAEAAAAGLNLPAISAGVKGKGLTVKADGSGYEHNLLSIVVPTRTALKALTTAIDRPVYLTESGRQGTFVLRTGAVPVTDTQEGVYVVSNTAGFYWERAYGAALPSVKAFGAAQDGATDDTAAFQGALDVLGSAIMLASQGLKCKILGTIRLKNDRDQLTGIGRPWLVTGAVTPIHIESSFQKVGGFVIDGIAMTAAVGAILIRTTLRQMTTVDIGDLYLQDCFDGIKSEDSPSNVGIFFKIHDITMAGHRGYGIATWDLWASYHIDQVVVDRVGRSGANYNYPAFYFKGAEGIFFRNCAHNGSSATGIQPLQDGAVFELCNFVEFTNFIPDHSGGRGMVFITCANVKGDKSTLVNCGNHGLVVSGGSMFDLDSITSTQLAASATLADAFNVDSVQGFRAKGLYGSGFKRNGIFANACQRMNVQGEFSNNANRGIVTLGASSANLFHGCLTASNTAGNYSLAASSDYLRDHIVSAGTIGDATGPAAA